MNTREQIIKIHAEILENKSLGADFYQLRLKFPEQVKALPAQFVMLSFAERRDLYLPRPFSIFDCEGNTLQILYKIVGKGSAYLASLREKDKLQCTMPLGNSFEKPDGADEVFLVGGGFGVAPLHFFKKYYASQLQRETHFLVGAKTREQLSFLPILKDTDEIHVATDDGSSGFKGFVTELFAKKFAEILETRKLKSVLILACGPSNMLKALKEMLSSLRLQTKVTMRAYFSMEARMACGFGVCNGCVVKTKNGYKRVCYEGPVFDADNLLFD